MSIETMKIIKNAMGPCIRCGSGFFSHNVGLAAEPFAKHVGKHLAVLPSDFDPATMDVVIVAKNARRVWIDRTGADTWFHVTRPVCGAWSDWVSENMMVVDGMVMDGMQLHDCIEFVAVETRRPPEPVKPVEPNADYDPLTPQVYAMLDEAANGSQFGSTAIVYLMPPGCCLHFVCEPAPSLEVR